MRNTQTAAGFLQNPRTEEVAALRNDLHALLQASWKAHDLRHWEGVRGVLPQARVLHTGLLGVLQVPHQASQTEGMLQRQSPLPQGPNREGGHTSFRFVPRPSGYSHRESLLLQAAAQTSQSLLSRIGRTLTSKLIKRLISTDEPSNDSIIYNVSSPTMTHELSDKLNR